MPRSCLSWILVWPAIAILIAITSWVGSHHKPLIAVMTFLAGAGLILFGLASWDKDEDGS